ncbi:RNA polymerase II C-terminal domain phosphatase-like [Heracleum sosnowskyi]|uniref:RNA polymerase II C-terminal domain phosphatase-like n=1 Tax=Heracleum sosnowskyi TaxID=360622 RepID=A0AAD8HIF1_9APIA|nr:RNA polymerase II C-terminal domain phosphatase-like [Heracleum sosnowskyi]
MAQVLNKFYESKVIKNIKLKKLQSQKKLCLILDLDHTLVHTIAAVKRGDNLRRPAGTFRNADIFRRKFKGVEHMTKLRPFVRKFLKEASNLFEMYIYTLGSREYALGMASILDPRGVYFGSRIISSEDSTEVNGKSLDVLPDVDESFVLILDDLDVVWPKYLCNLILMKKYVYFSQTGSSNETIKVFRDEYI